MIGSGIFLVSAEMSRLLGSTGWLLAAWVLTGIITLFAALSYGELAGMMPKAGGQYVYIQRAFGKLTAFVYGWTVFSVIQTGVIAAVAVAFAKYAGQIFPFWNEDHFISISGTHILSWSKVLAIGLILFLTFVNTLGVEEGKWLQRVFTTAKLLAILGLVFAAFFVYDGPSYLEHNTEGLFDAMNYPSTGFGWESIGGIALLAAFGTAMVGSLFSSDAWNNVTFIAGEIRNPAKNIPKSLFFGTLIVTVLYLLANLAYLQLLPLKGQPAPDIIGQGISHAQFDRVGTSAAQVIFGPAGMTVMALLIMVSTFGCNNGIILAGARLFNAMSIDGLFFKQAARLNKHRVPAWALWLQAAWASVLCLSGSYGELLKYCTFASLLFYIVTVLGLFMLRKREPLAERPYRVIAYPFTPALYILMAGFVAVSLLVFDWKNSLIGIGIVAAGIPIYFLIQQKKE